MGVLEGILRPGCKVLPPYRKGGSRASVLPWADLCISTDSRCYFGDGVSLIVSLPGSGVSPQPDRACELSHEVLVFPLSTFAWVCFVVRSLIGGRT